jgi:hypothetical protein
MGVSMRSVAVVVASVGRVMMTMAPGTSATSGISRRKEGHHANEYHDRTDDYCKRLAHEMPPPMTNALEEPNLGADARPRNRGSP